MRWWHVEPVLRLEHELFPEESWSAAAFWNELAETDTRHYVVALLDGAVVGYAGLAIFGDEAHVLTIGVTRTVQGGGIGTALLRDLFVRSIRERASEFTTLREGVRRGDAPLGQHTEVFKLISRLNRSIDTPEAISGGSTFTTTDRPSAVSSATNTRDMPPPPISRSTV